MVERRSLVTRTRHGAWVGTAPGRAGLHVTGVGGGAGGAAAEIGGRGAGEEVAVLLAGPAGSAMQNVINTVKGKALEVAEYLTPVLKVPLGAGAWRGAGWGEGRRAFSEVLVSFWEGGGSCRGRGKQPRPPLRGVTLRAAAARTLVAPYVGSRLRGPFPAALAGRPPGLGVAPSSRQPRPLVLRSRGALCRCGGLRQPAESLRGHGAPSRLPRAGALSGGLSAGTALGGKAFGLHPVRPAPGRTGRGTLTWSSHAISGGSVHLGGTGLQRLGVAGPPARGITYLLPFSVKVVKLRLLVSPGMEIQRCSYTDT